MRPIVISGIREDAAPRCFQAQRRRIVYSRFLLNYRTRLINNIPAMLNSFLLVSSFRYLYEFILLRVRNETSNDIKFSSEMIILLDESLEFSISGRREKKLSDRTLINNKHLSTKMAIWRR